MLILNPINLQKMHAKKVITKTKKYGEKKLSFFTFISMSKSSFVLLCLVFSKQSKSLHPTMKVLKENKDFKIWLEDLPCMFYQLIEVVV